MLDIATSSQAVGGHPTQATADPASKIAAAVRAADSAKNGLSSAETERRLASSPHATAAWRAARVQVFPGK